MKTKEKAKKIWKIVTHNFAFVAIASLLWLLYRSGTKPTRITYPCQKAAAANVGMFMYAFPVVYYKRFDHFLKRRYDFRTVLKYSCIILVIFGLMVGTEYLVDSFLIQQSWRNYTPIKEPIGKKLDLDGPVVQYQSIPSAMALSSPHRVVTVHNSNASTWLGPVSGSPHDHLNQQEVSRMVERGITSLTGETDPVAAWQSLIPYQAGEAVVIKLNFNNQGHWYDEDDMNPYAELVNSIIDALINMGVPGNRIWLADPSRVGSDPFMARITNQEVLFYTSYSTGGRERVVRTPYVDASSPEANVVDFSEDPNSAIRISQVFVDADHIINVPQLKGHGTTSGSITLGLKNHYGSAIIGSEGRSYWHKYFYLRGSAYRTGPNPIIEINRNTHIFNKTRLTIGDGLYGHPVRNNPDDGDARMLFESFGENPPEILFFGVDPVAVDSVMFDYLQRECLVSGYTARSDAILEDAALLGLGVFEHWDGDDTRQYSVIDYIEIDLDAGACLNCLPLSCNSYADCSPGTGSCASGYCCQGTCTDLPPDLADQTIVEGNDVNIVIEGTNCDGKDATLTYYEVDVAGNNLFDGTPYGLPASLTFSAGEARFSWTAQWFDDIDGDVDNNPEIMFDAVCEGDSYTSDVLEIIPTG